MEPEVLPGFHIDILSLFWHDFGYQYTNVWDQLKTSDQSVVAFRINSDDVEVFNPVDCSFTLTSVVSEQLEEKFGAALSKLLTLKAGFILSVDDIKLCGGTFIEIGSAAAIRFPVLYVVKPGKQFILYLRPEHSIYWPRWTVDVEATQFPEADLIQRYFERCAGSNTGCGERQRG
jgi:hypothetical protein